MPKFSKILSAVCRGKFLIEENAAMGFLPIIINLIEGKSLAFNDDDSEKKEPITPLLYYKDATGNIVSVKADIQQSGNIYKQAPKGSVAVIPFKGPVMKEDYCDSPGTATLKNWVSQADQSENINAIIIDTDGPGGLVDGTFEFSDAIGNTSKPVVAYIDGLAASATYGGIAQANHIMASHNSAEIGSIGTMVRFFNYDERYKSIGIKEIIVRAEGSHDKNEAYYQAMQGKDDLIKTEQLNPLNEIFHQTVKKGRTGKLNIDKSNEPLTGKIYLAADALKIGLIDSIAENGFSDAVNKALEFSQENKSIQTPTNNMKLNFKKAWTVATSLLGIAFGSEETTKEVELTQDNLNLLAEKAENLNNDLTKATQERDAFNTELSTVKQERETLQTQVNSLTKENGELKKLPGVMQSLAKKQGVDPTTTTVENEFKTSVDEQLTTLKEQINQQ